MSQLCALWILLGFIANPEACMPAAKVPRWTFKIGEISPPRPLSTIFDGYATE